MLDQASKERLLKHYPVLGKVEPGLLERALSRARAVPVPAGALLFDELKPCIAFPFVLAGDVRVYKQSASGRELSLYNVAVGEACVVTAGCLLGDQPYNAAGRARRDALLVMMPGEDFELLLSCRVFREFVFSLFSQRIVGLMQLVEEVAFRKLDQRLASLLLARGNPVRASHQELADELGTVREIVSRLLAGLADENLIALSRGLVEISDRAGLELIARS